MVQIDFSQREVTIKLVYYGPALSGKTTNLQQLHARIDAPARGRLMTLDTRDDRTLFFDLLPVFFRTGGGLQLKLKVFTVPGQVMHNSTRKMVLAGADGVAFIADSQITETRSNNDSYANLKENLRENGIRWEDLPVVIQFNKRDLPETRSDQELARIARKGREPLFRATAIRGEGVVETFLALLELTWTSLDARYRLEERFGIGGDDFMDQVCRYLKIEPGHLGPAEVPR